MIIVRTNHNIYGPFETSDDALAWVKQARSSIVTSALPLSVEELIDPLERVPNFKGAARRLDELKSHAAKMVRT